MASKRLSMRKTQEVLRLKARGLSNREIARVCSIGRTTVANYLSRAAVAGLSWPLPEDMGDEQLERLLFPPPLHPSRERDHPDWAKVHQELKKKGVTLALVWEEYKAHHPEGYQYSQFCELYRRWRGKLSVWMRQEHKAGEKLFIDYCGQTVDVVDPATGESKAAQIFVAVLGASNYTYAEAVWSQGLPDWIASHQRAFHYFGGVPELVVIDNLKSGVTKTCRYEPDLNPTYQDMATHYGTAVLPARVRKPRDKAKVEAGVLLVERWILAALRHRIFFSLAELNQAISDLLEKLNARPFKKLPGSRRSLFESLDKPALKPLPQAPYQYAEWKKVKVHIDYHVEVDRHYYSIPYQLAGKRLDVRFTAQTVECFHKGRRVASHRRNYRRGGFTTLPEHMPTSHREYLKWTPGRLLNWAAKIGPSTAGLASAIMESRAHPQQGFRSILGILRLSDTYGHDRLEAACQRAMAIKAMSFKSVQSILKNGLDRRPIKENNAESAPIRHPNIRGAAYYSTRKGEDHADSSHLGETGRHETVGDGQSPGGTDGHRGHQLPLI
jgi:transposase